MISNILPGAEPPKPEVAVVTPENAPAATPQPAPIETTETSRKVEETTTTTKPTQGAAETQTPAQPQA